MIRLKKRKTVFVALFAAIMLAITGSFVVAGEPSGQKVKSEVRQKKYLVLDSRIIDSTSNASLELGTPIKHLANPLFYVDEPWVTGADRMYPSVVYDKKDKLYKCWYQPWLAGHTEALLYAESKDGLNWLKPNLGLVSENGSTANTLVSIITPAFATL